MTNKVTLSYGAAAASVVALASVLLAAPAFAYEGGHGSWGKKSSETDNSVSIVVTNSASVSNISAIKAMTGGNWAGGSFGGNAGKGAKGGNGGDVEGQNGLGESHGGNGGNGGMGGNGGHGGPGGLVTTGDAHAAGTVTNMINSTEVDVERADCGCNDSEAKGWFDHYGYFHQYPTTSVNNKVKVEVGNSASLTNESSVRAKTGRNDAVGSVGGNGAKGGKGGNGGDVETEGRKIYGHGDWYAEYFGHSFGGDAGNGAHGGQGGNGGVGGTIDTGAAMATDDVVNVINSAIVRVR